MCDDAPGQPVTILSSFTPVLEYLTPGLMLPDAAADDLVGNLDQFGPAEQPLAQGAVRPLARFDHQHQQPGQVEQATASCPGHLALALLPAGLLLFG